MKKNKRANPFLLQREFTQTVRSLSKDKKRLLSQCILTMVSDFKVYGIEYLKVKYHVSDNYDEEALE